MVEKMKAGKVAGEDRGGVERRNGQYEKEGKAGGKGGHIVESRPGFLFVHSADKSLFVVYQALSPSLLIPLFSKHVILNMIFLQQMDLKHAI